MRGEVRQIVIPVDFGEQSLIALKQSYNLATKSGSEITLVHVIDDDFFNSFQNMMSSKSNYEEEYKNEVSEKLKKLAGDVAIETGIRVHAVLRVGKIYEEIVDIAKSLNAALIIMGTMGAVGLKKKIVGSNASRVVREAECPVITIKGKAHRFGIKHILLPLDLTKETKEKVDKAIELAQMFGSVIHIVTIVESNDEFILKKLTRQMNQVNAFISNADVECTSEFVEDEDVVDGILKTAQKTESDLIMIMTQQEVGFTDLFISSAAQEIINNSDIPVLSIRPAPKKNLTSFVIQ